MQGVEKVKVVFIKDCPELGHVVGDIAGFAKSDLEGLKVLKGKVKRYKEGMEMPATPVRNVMIGGKSARNVAL